MSCWFALRFAHRYELAVSGVTSDFCHDDFPAHLGRELQKPKQIQRKSWQDLICVELISFDLPLPGLRTGWAKSHGCRRGFFVWIEHTIYGVSLAFKTLPVVYSCIVGRILILNVSLLFLASADWLVTNCPWCFMGSGPHALAKSA